MKILNSPDELTDWRDGQRSKIVIVPTMGALHEGHLALIDRARGIAGDAGQVLATIFVNPLQFDKKGDLDSYPQTLESDLAACRARGADAVFVPKAGDLYHADRSIIVTESRLSARLCGATRPGHFDGVCTVVLKLFLLSGASDGVFGKKDFQQLAIIRRMVRDLNVPIEIHGVETYRDSDGLALSSRNARLTPEHRAVAPVIRQALLQAEKDAQSASAADVLDTARARIESSLDARVDYLELVDRETLQPADSFSRPTTLAAAVFYNDVRLIDHIEIDGRYGA